MTKINSGGFSAVMVSIVTLVLFIVSVGLATFSINNLLVNNGQMLGGQMATISSGLGNFITINQNSLIANSTIGGVANAKQPTISELQLLGFIDSNLSQSPPYGGSYNLLISVAPNGCTDSCKTIGQVYLSNPVYNSSRSAIDGRILEAAVSNNSSGSVGFSLPGSTSLITGPGWTMPNPDPQQRAGILMATSGLVTTNSSLYWKAPVANFASLPSVGNQAGDGRVTLDNSRAYTWNGSAWVALAVDQNGNMSLSGNLSAGTVTPSQQVVGGSCSTTGSIAQDSAGNLLTCVSNFWTRVQGNLTSTAVVQNSASSSTLASSSFGQYIKAVASGAQTIYLPTPVGNSGKEITICSCNGVNPTSINGNGFNIKANPYTSGGTSFSLPVSAVVTLVSDGSGWYSLNSSGLNGSYAGTAQYNGDATLNASDIGKLIIGGGGSSNNYTLPPSSVAVIGSRIQFVGQSATKYIYPSSGDALWSGGGTIAYAVLTGSNTTSITYVGGNAWMVDTPLQGSGAISGGCMFGGGWGTATYCGQGWMQCASGSYVFVGSFFNSSGLGQWNSNGTWANGICIKS